MKLFDVVSSIVCDDIRQEITQKFILVGIYQEILVPSLPLTMPLSWWFELLPHHRLHILPVGSEKPQYDDDDTGNDRLKCHKVDFQLRQRRFHLGDVLLGRQRRRLGHRRRRGVGTLVGRAGLDQRLPQLLDDEGHFHASRVTPPVETVRGIHRWPRR